jgi:hypothetical protein
MGAFYDLPGDIIERIIKYVPTECSRTPLSLISRVWFPWARHFDPEFAYVLLHTKNMSRFLLLLQSPLCSFPRYVRQLDIDWSVGTIPPCSQDILLNILSDPHRWADIPSMRTNNSKSIILKMKKSMLNLRTPPAKECHALNLVCLFPRLEHLQVQLMGIKSNIPNFEGQPCISQNLYSLSVICNSSPQQPGTVPHEWKHFLKWARSAGINDIGNLYLTCMGPWNYEGAGALVKLQGTSLKHLHFGPQREASQYCE